MCLRYRYRTYVCIVMYVFQMSCVRVNICVFLCVPVQFIVVLERDANYWFYCLLVCVSLCVGVVSYSLVVVEYFAASQFPLFKPPTDV